MISVAVIFNKWAAKSLYLLLFISGIAIIVLSYYNEYLHILSAICIIGAAAGFTFRMNRSFQFYLLVTTLSLTIIFSLNYHILKNYKNVDILTKSKDTFIEILKKSENLPEADKNELSARLNESMDIIKNVIPFSYFLNYLFLSLFSVSFLKQFFIRKYTEKSSNLEGIEKFRIKDYLIFVLIAGWIAVLLVDENRYHIFYIIGLNTALVLSALYLIQALGIIKFFLIKKGLPTLILPVLIIIILFFGIEYLIFALIILASLGALDFWADF
ncbi:MAG: YybS family protein [Spirochaetes bacterium]|nr:YybS family protein [Spirochaetota bacterium]